MNRRNFIKWTAAAGTVAVSGRAFAWQLAGHTPAPVSYTVETHPAIIVGTGYGGAVCALHLANAGVKTLLLEMGLDWTGLKQFSPMVSPKPSSCYLKASTPVPIDMFRLPNLIYTGVLDREDFPSMKVYVGRGVGGGSLVNGGMAVTPRQDYLARMMPMINVQEMYTKYFPLANQRLKVNAIPPQYLASSEYYQYARTGIAEATKAGFKTVTVPNVYDFNYMQQEEAGTVPKSALGGEVIFGNNYGKNSVDKTYLAAAIRTGNIKLKTLRIAEDIRWVNGMYELTVKVTNTLGIRVGTETYRTPKLFMAAGSIGTTQLLVRARETKTLPLLNSDVGQGWGHNGNIMSGRNFTTSTGKKQATIPVAGIDNWDHPQYPSFTEISPFPIGIETWTALYLSITINPNRGHFTYNKLKGQAELVWTEAQNQPSVDAAKYLVNQLNKANDGTVAGLLFPTDGIRSDISYHPLGGCLLGKATDLYGRVKGYNGLYIMDGALIPGSVGVNPFVTITALAERNMDKVMAEDF